MKALFLFLLFFIAGANGYAQTAIPDLRAIPRKRQLDVLASACDSLGKAEAYDEGLEVARYALQLTPANDEDHLALFTFHIGAYYQGSNTDSALYYLERSLSYARRAGNRQRIVSAIGRLLFVYTSNAGHTERRDHIAAEVQHIVDTAGNTTIRQSLYNDLANYYGTTGMRELQMKYLLEDLDISMQKVRKGGFSINDSANLGVSCINIAAAYLMMGHEEKALEYTMLGRPFLYGYQAGRIHYHKNMAMIYLQLSQPEKAIPYYDTLTRIVALEPDWPAGWSVRMALDLSFADYYVSKGQSAKALSTLKEAEKVIPRLGDDEFLIAQFRYMMGRALVNIKDYQAALTYLKLAESRGQEMGLESYADILRELAQCHAALKQWPEAGAYYARYLPIRDSLYTTTSQQSVAEAEAKYQNKDKQQQIDIQRQQLKFAREQRMWLIGGLLLAALTAGLLIVIYRNKKRTADLLSGHNQRLSQLNDALQEANTTKAKLFGIIGHDLRSPISQVYQFLKLQQHSPELLDGRQRQLLNEKIQLATGSLLETMEDLLLWSKTQLSQFTTHIQPVVADEAVNHCIQLLKLNAEAKQISILKDIPPDAVVQTDPYYLQTIIRNLLQNALKATPPGETIKICLNPANELTITNMGPHFSQEDFMAILHAEDHLNLSGLGLKLVDELCHKIGAVITFSAGGNGGTTVSVKLP